MKYFAYGANMYTPHFLAQVPQALFLGIAKLNGYQLFFHKLGNIDGSGKCNIVPTRDPSHIVYGVLYDIPPKNRHILDKAENLGYGNHDITLKVCPVQKSLEGSYLESGEGVFAFTYIAHKDRIQQHLVPFTWYKALILAGAKEHHLPESYIHALENYQAIPDPNPHREEDFTSQITYEVL